MFTTYREVRLIRSPTYRELIVYIYIYIYIDTTTTTTTKYTLADHTGANATHPNGTGLTSALSTDQDGSVKFPMTIVVLSVAIFSVMAVSTLYNRKYRHDLSTLTGARLVVVCSHGNLLQKTVIVA